MRTALVARAPSSKQRIVAGARAPLLWNYRVRVSFCACAVWPQISMDIQSLQGQLKIQQYDTSTCSICNAKHWPQSQCVPVTCTQSSDFLSPTHKSTCPGRSIADEQTVLHNQTHWENDIQGVMSNYANSTFVIVQCNWDNPTISPHICSCPRDPSSVSAGCIHRL